jgi:hypothetical protein
MMNMLQRMGRAVGITSAMAGIALMGTAAPVMAHDDDDHGCARYALVSCQNDGDDSYQCFEERYQACLDFFHGGGSAGAADYLRQDGVLV